MGNFELDILKALESTFEEGSIETLVFRSESSEVPDYPIKVFHKPTGIEAVCDAYESQVKNKAMALAQLINILNYKS